MEMEIRRSSAIGFILSYIYREMFTHIYTGCIILFQKYLHVHSPYTHLDSTSIYIFSFKCVLPLTIASAKSDLVPAFSRLKSV